MKMLGTVVVGVTLAGLIGAAHSAEQPSKKPAAPAKKAASISRPSLAGVTWADAPITWDALRGKTVVVLVYAPHPDAEERSGPFFEQLKAAICDKPIVVLAIDASKRGDGGFAYAKKKGCSAPNIILGRDPAMPARLGLECEFFEYDLFDQEGKLSFASDAEVCSPIPLGGQTPQFLLTRIISACPKKRSYLGSFRVLTDDMTPKVKQLLWPLELDRYVSESSLKAAKHKLTDAERQCIDKALDRFLTAQLDAMAKLSRGEPAERLLGYEKATLLSAVYKGRDEAKKAQALGKELAQDAKLRRELAAKRAFQKVMQQAGDDLPARARSMARLAKTFKGTYYGQLAANGGKAPEIFHSRTLNPLKLLPETEQKKLVAQQQAACVEIGKKLPGIVLHAYETKRFLFFSDLSDGFVRNTLLPYLDRMYDELCMLYGLDPAHRIWNGKTVVYTFASEAEYRRFETVCPEMRVTEFAANGACHTNPDGTVTIACYVGDDLNYFAALLVHETTHGFNHFYRSECRLPSWIDEGAAEWVADRTVGGSRGIRGKVAKAVAQMQRTRSLGGDFFTSEHIQLWQYGAAFGITNFLVTYVPKPAAGKTPPGGPHGKSRARAPIAGSSTPSRTARLGKKPSRRSTR